MTLEILTTPALRGLTHGFFTRRGGVSKGVYEGLNCGPGSDDAPEAVAENRARVAQALGVAPERLYSLHQVHSADVVVVDETTRWAEKPRADALVTATPGIAIGALAADCAPVLFADPGAGVVGAAHSGWKGAIGGVLEATLDAMEGLGADRARITAVVGPAISQRAYEVGPEFMDRFLDEDPDHDRFFAGGSGDRAMFDLPGFVLHRLRGAGVGSAEWIGHCTYSDPGRFYSYRRTTHAREPDYGRLISAIRL
ncbi:peptidoglycan editing factor PgeF [Halovulum dunhuangense]|uniref:Purine nucleoside phosphorylase n=1 Tax=Halovulum dunhuangense TaxID=1505036 RepID=A0A849L5U9_9RHOB|nr:peptidoglycan editing factor PgeF [Halovulum dunhuangense]NNU81633.1 peptidoglycan editing factor PgeF [Halovulum dunhuangense]